MFLTLQDHRVCCGHVTSSYAFVTLKPSSSHALFCLCPIGTSKPEALITVPLPQTTTEKFPPELLSLILDDHEVPVGLLACCPGGELKLWPDLRQPSLDVGVNLGLVVDEHCSFLRHIEDQTYCISTSNGRLFVLSYQVT